MKRVNFRESSFDVFIGRSSKWGNPFPIRKDRTREQSVELYEKWIRNKPELLADLGELKGKILGCWCKEDELCHGDILIRLIKELHKEAGMFYALRAYEGHKFLCVVSGHKGSTELTSGEHQQIIENIPVDEEWIECVWSYTHPETEMLLENMEGIEKGEKAEEFLNYYIQEYFEEDDE